MSECIKHPGNISRTTGYGRVWVDQKWQGAHRVAYEEFYGPIPAGMCVLHRCDNRPCVNPEHLFLGTFADNNQDRAKKGRSFHPSGESHPRVKLTAQEVKEIRRIAGADPARTKTRLARQYGVSHSCVSDILAGRTWVGN